MACLQVKHRTFAPPRHSFGVRGIDGLIGGISCALIFTGGRRSHSFACVFHKLLELHAAAHTITNSKSPQSSRSATIACVLL